MKIKKQKGKNGTAIWIDEIGAISLRVFNVVEEDKDKKTITISFGKDKIYEINKLNVRSKRILMYEKSDGKVICQNPNMIGRIDLKAQGIKTLRFNLQNSSLQESRSAIHRWTTVKTAIDKLAPLFRLMFICITIGVLGWAALKFGGVALDRIAASRLLECSQLLPRAPAPIAAIVNGSIPLGVA